MTLIITIFGGLGGLEVLIWLSPFWKWRKGLALALMASNILAGAALLLTDLQTWTLLFVVLLLYRLLNLLRLVRGRIQPDYLYHAAWRTSISLLGLQVIVLTAAGLSSYYSVTTAVWLRVLVAVELAAAMSVVVTTSQSLRTIRAPKTRQSYPERDLPALTVALPARNETVDLEACLQSLTANDYPKLEILVLDDCSQNKRTPEIIREFAHQGVRFVAGAVPPEHWLAKNYAYQQLTDAANGELLLFCGVDARFEPGSLRAMVTTMLAEKKTMLSFVPRNQVPPSGSLLPLLVQPARYAWELALPRPAGRPPVLSTCWLITAQALHMAGSFKAVSRGHSPESHFARTAQRQHDSYAFLQADSTLGLTSFKSFDEQRATAIRTRYPQLHRRPEAVGLASLAEGLILLLPFVLLVTSLLTRQWGLALGSALSCLLLSIMCARITALTYRRSLWRGWWLLPVMTAYDIALLNYSMWQYEFGEVIWKGRNICIPVMRVIPALPKLEDD